MSFMTLNKFMLTSCFCHCDDIFATQNLIKLNFKVRSCDDVEGENLFGIWDFHRKITKHIKGGQSCARTQNNKGRKKRDRRQSFYSSTWTHYIINFIPSSTMNGKWKSFIHHNKTFFSSEAFCDTEKNEEDEKQNREHKKFPLSCTNTAVIELRERERQFSDSHGYQKGWKLLGRKID